MSKIVRLIRNGNEGPFAEGNEGTVLEDGYFRVTESVFNDLATADLVDSFWTGKKIVPDGTSPKFKDVIGQLAILTGVTAGFGLGNKSSVVDKIIHFTAADYGYKDDHETDLPDPS